jgi:transposase
MRYRKKTYTAELREQVVREYLSGSDTTNEISERYGLSSGLLSYWVKRSGREKVPETAEDAHMLRTRIAELERMVGRLTMENDLLKKFAAYTKQQTSERSSIVTARTLAASRRDAGYLGLPGAATTTGGEIVRSKVVKMPGSRND